MADSLKVIRVFLASPNDLKDERTIANEVISEFNALLSDDNGYHLDLVGWEDTASVFGRPQETINAEVDRCELFIGMMYRRWGTPPDKTGAFSSGFEEEFTRAVARRKSTGKPEVSLYFKKIDEDTTRDPGDEAKKVLAFKKHIIEEKFIYFEEFADQRDFEKKLRRCVIKYIQKLGKANAEPAIETQATNPTSTALNRANNPEIGESAFSSVGADFLKSFISKTEGDLEENPVTATEVARFRLLALVLKRNGNDVQFIGVHDANLLFDARAAISLGLPECRILAESGLHHLSSENAPLWHWLLTFTGDKIHFLTFASLFGEDQKRAGAITALGRLGGTIFEDDVFQRSTVIGYWLSEDTPKAVKQSALKFLRWHGKSVDIPAIDEELLRSDYSTRSLAIEANITINFRDGRESGIRALYDLQPETVSTEILSMLFKQPTPLSSEILAEGVLHKSPAVREIVANILAARKELSVEVAEKLLVDSSASARHAGIMALVASGRDFTESEAKEILVKPKPGSGIGLASIWANNSDESGEAYFEAFCKNRLKRLSKRELDVCLVDESAFDVGALVTLCERDFKARGSELRRLIADKFKSHFTLCLNELEKSTGSPDVADRIRGLENFLRQRFTRRALDVICHKSEAKDLNLVRSALLSGFVNFENGDVEFLRKHGDWSDVQLLVNLAEKGKSRSGASILIGSTLPYGLFAQAICQLAKGRVDQLLTLNMPTPLLSAVVAELHDKEVAALSDLSIEQLLLSSDSDTRRISALKAIRALPKSRLKSLLDRYAARSEKRYYNVIHWLDMGVSMTRTQAVLAAGHLLLLQK